MSTVQVQTSVELSDLLQGVRRLDSSTLEEFADEVMQLRAERRASSLSKNEADLLRIINRGLPDATRLRFAELKAKREAESLTSSEHAELLSLVEQIEQRNVERIEALSRLGRLRGIPVRELMRQLDLQQPHDA